MKKSIIILCALLISVSAFSQQQQRRGFFNRVPEPVPVVFTPVNELSFNLMSAVFLSHPEITYERVFREDMSFGVSVGLLTGNSNAREPIVFNLTPYFRWFFGGNRTSMNKPGAGFFVEAHGAILYRERTVWNPGFGGNWGHHSTENQFGAGIGMGIGWKFVSANNWASEILLGMGRGSVTDWVYPRVGVSIGRRF